MEHSTQLIVDAINKSGKKKGYLAERLGISRPTLLKKMNGLTDWNCKELKILFDELRLSKEEINNIFLH